MRIFSRPSRAILRFYIDPQGIQYHRYIFIFFCRFFCNNPKSVCCVPLTFYLFQSAYLQHLLSYPAFYSLSLASSTAACTAFPYRSSSAKISANLLSAFAIRIASFCADVGYLESIKVSIKFLSMLFFSLVLAWLPLMFPSFQKRQYKNDSFHQSIL